MTQPLKSATGEADSAQRIKYLVLALLVVQNVATILSMKQASRQPAEDGRQALTTSIVVMVELFKVTICSLEIIVRKKGIYGLYSEISTDILSKRTETAMMMVPCFLYFVQNNLLLLAVANLDPPVYYVVSQLKILATALFSILILKKQISMPKWIALLILIFGTVLSQSDFQVSGTNVFNSVGLGAAICAVFTSGLAGVLCERQLKHGSSNVSMSIRNVQLGVPSCCLGLAALYLQNSEQIITGGFFQGFTYWTWTVVFLHSLGGLLVTAVMKFADNLLKGFAMAASLISACFLSVHFFEFVLTSNFIFGALLVVFSTFMYLADDNFLGGSKTPPATVELSETTHKKEEDVSVEEDRC
mmetsp:Transcript_23236/g.37321  ORF Transcript_23236/g.37321 Transcript_23236/m.37321 type:complete len:359 (-) Transcript_23236:386-1462(-)